MAEPARSCRVLGCGPPVLVSLPSWRGPWRRRRQYRCWVCERPLDPAEVRAANARWDRVKAALTTAGGRRG